MVSSSTVFPAETHPKARPDAIVSLQETDTVEPEQIAQLAKSCGSCGNIYKVDSLYCRRCGVQRGGQIVASPDSSPPRRRIADNSIHEAVRRRDLPEVNRLIDEERSALSEAVEEAIVLQISK